MNKLDSLALLQQIVDLKYRQQQESFARLMAQENKLRNALRRLDETMTASQHCNDTPQKAIGADVIWQAWVGRKKKELNIQLSQVLAVKERHVAQVRAAYGKVLVTNDLHNKVAKDMKKQKAQSALDRAITSQLFKTLQ